MDDLREVHIPSASGSLHRLEDIASVNYGRGRARVTRVNQDKQIELFYSFSRDVEESRDLLEGYRSEIDQLVSGYNLPSGVAVEVFPEEDMFADWQQPAEQCERDDRVSAPAGSSGEQRYYPDRLCQHSPPARLSPQQGVDDGWAVTYSPDPNYFHHDDRSHVADGDG